MKTAMRYHITSVRTASVKKSDVSVVVVQLLIISNILSAHGLQHIRPPCPSFSPGVCSCSCTLSQWCPPTISSSKPLLLLPLIFPSIRVFPNESTVHFWWPKYWGLSFSINPSKGYLRLISLKIDWFDLLSVNRISRGFSSTTIQKITSSMLSLLYCHEYHIPTWLLEKS